MGQGNGQNVQGRGYRGKQAVGTLAQGGRVLGLAKRGWRIYDGHSMVSPPGRATVMWKVGRAVIASVRDVLAREGKGDE